MHSCPECNAACYCNGDVDDIDTGDEEAIENCIHFTECEGGEDGDFDLWLGGM